MALTKPELSTQIQTTTAKFDDPIIEINSALTGANTDDLGILMNRGTSGDHVGIIWDRTAGAFALIETTSDGDAAGDITFSALADLQVKTITTENFNLPAADGTLDQVLTTDGNGVVTWEDAAGAWLDSGTDLYISAAGITDSYFATALTSATPVDHTMHGQGGLGTDIAGAAITIAGGQGTGTGTGGSIIFQTALAGLTGSSLNALSDALIINEEGHIGLSNTAHANWWSTFDVLELGDSNAIFGDINNGLYLTQNLYFTGAGSPKAYNTGVSSYAQVTNGRFRVFTAASVGQGGTPAFNNGLTIENTGAAVIDGLDIQQDSLALTGALLLASGSSTASATNALAIGYNVNSRGQTAIALGYLADAKEINNIAIGLSTQAGQTNGGTAESGAIAIGNASKAYEASSISIGNAAISGVSGTTLDPGGVAIGWGAKATGIYTVGIGRIAEATIDYGVALGYSSNANASATVALGRNATALESSSISIGYNSQAGQNAGANVEIQSIAIGYLAKAFERDSISIGTGANTGLDGTTSNSQGIAIGTGAFGTGSAALAIGDGANAYEQANIAIGDAAQSGQISGGNTERDAISIGTGAKAYESNGISIGNAAITGVNSQTGSPDAIAVGVGANAISAHSIALGRGASASAANAIALGRDAVASVANSMAIGSNTYPIISMYLGKGYTSSIIGSAYLRGSGGLGTDINGSGIAIVGGQGTGSGIGGPIDFYTALAGGTGSSLNAITKHMTIDQSGEVLIESGVLKVAETSADAAPGAGYGQVWVKNTTETTLWFTDSGDVDFQIGGGGLSAGEWSVTGTDLLQVTAALTDVYFSDAITDATPLAQTLHAQGGTGTDIAGADLTIAGGQGTGTGVAGEILFQTATAGTTGSSLNALVTRMRIGEAGGVLINEITDAETDVAGYGQVWVKDDTPNKLMFTDDAGADIAVTGTVNDTVQTTDATQTTLQTIAIPSDEEKIIVARVHGHEDATDDHVWMTLNIGAKNITGTASLVGGIDSVTGYDAGATTWVITASASSGNIIIQVTGEGSHTINWRTTTEID